MNNTQKEYCRKFTRIIRTDDNALELFRKKINEAAKQANVEAEDPETKHVYHHSYDNIIRCLLQFDAPIPNVNIDPKILPKGQLTNPSPITRSSVIANFKGQIRSDKGGKAITERTAGFYAWMNLHHSEIAENFHNIISSGKNATLKLPDFLLIEALEFKPQEVEGVFLEKGVEDTNGEFLKTQLPPNETQNIQIHQNTNENEPTKAQNTLFPSNEGLKQFCIYFSISTLIGFAGYFFWFVLDLSRYSIFSS